MIIVIIYAFNEHQYIETVYVYLQLSLYRIQIHHYSTEKQQFILNTISLYADHHNNNKTLSREREKKVPNFCSFSLSFFIMQF